ncbi:MAG: hypothetical protein JXA71_11660 [Chitinispirillaceae bacterium]|nr:hypothetical protein [Chitinispirillaceae bacterium]
MRFRVSVFIGIIFCLLYTVSAEQYDVKVKNTGFVYLQIGQIQHVTPPDDALPDRMFDQHFNARITLDALIHEHLRIILGGEAEYGAVITKDMSQKKSVLLKEAQGVYSFGDPENSFLQIAAGYFPFKYNPEASNLGEYLFRTGAYPGYIITEFDFAKIRLMGFRVSSTLFNSLNLHALFTSEYIEPPYFDYSLSFLAGYKFLSNIFDIGAGVNLNRILPIVPEMTTDRSNLVTDDQLDTVFENGVPLYYTKKGTKLMARLTIDPKPFFPFIGEMLGPHEGKLYGEVAVLGVKDYGTYYPDITKRIPRMAGFNFPAFPALTYGVLPIGMFWGWRHEMDLKMLIASGISLIAGGGAQALEIMMGDRVGKILRMDILSGEIEYYGCDPKRVSNLPTGSSAVKPTDYLPEGMPRSLWKWSFYGQKTLTHGMAIKGLIGRDHYRSVNQVGNYDAIERMNGPGDWHYNIRIMYSF